MAGSVGGYLALQTPLSQAQAADVPPFVVPQFQKYAASVKMTSFENLRDTRYCEVWLFSASGKISYFNTFGNNNAADVKDTCPAAKWDPIVAKDLAATWKVDFVFKNGPRWWVTDRATIEAATDSTDFSGINARWMGGSEFPPKALAELQSGTFPIEPYHPVPSLRRSTYIFEKGKPVFMLVSPDGTKWVMQAFTNAAMPSLTYATLPQLGASLKLPAGWKYETKVLTKDLTLIAPDGRQTIVSDNLHSVYNGCIGAACSYVP